MNKDHTPILVWDFPTRAFHWLLALSFLGAYLSGEADGYRMLHVIFGYTVAGLLAFRLVWGVAGTRYARFSGFALSPRAALAYAKSLVSGRPQHFNGHNPLGGWAVLALLLLLGLTVASGIANYLELGGEAAEEVHEAAASAALALVVLHIAAVLVSGVLHRENLVRAMVTGTKRGDPAHAASGRRIAVALALFAAVAMFWAGAFSPPGMHDNPGLIAAATQPASGGEEDDD